jgi:hypothetical protein
MSKEIYSKFITTEIIKLEEYIKTIRFEIAEYNCRIQEFKKLMLARENELKYKTVLLNELKQRKFYG